MRNTTIFSETRRRSRRRWKGVTCCATVALLGSFVAAQQFEISRSTMDGGGMMHSQGGAFELSGTIGQPDAGMLSGGSFDLIGGFWFPIPPADCNDDGLISLTDAADFAACMHGPDTAATTACRCFDVDMNGTVDLADFTVMQIEFYGN